MERTTVKRQPAEKRVKNFNEVSLGYTKKLATEEAVRCPQCDDPVCIQGCPLGIDIRGFIRSLREGNAQEAYKKIKEQSCLMSVCGRICSAPCESACVLNEEGAPVGIKDLERYVSDHGRPKTIKKNLAITVGKKVAVIGSGPAGLSAAVELVKKGFQVTVFETFDKPGGILRYGIPEFRIPKKVLDQEIKEIESLGVTFMTNTLIGNTVSLEEIHRDYEAILLATGANIPKFMDIPGTSLGGVYYGEEFLMRVNRLRGVPMSKAVSRLPMGNNVAVIGSGNTALDCARIAVRFGKKATVLFRRTEEDMRVAAESRQLAKEEGVKLEPMVKPVEIIGNAQDFVSGLKCTHMDFADPDDTGEWQIMEVPDSEFTVNCDTVVIAIGHTPNSLLSQQEKGLKINRDGTIFADEKRGMTSVPGVFVAGNVMTNAGPVVNAMASGKQAANDIEQYLK